MATTVGKLSVNLGMNSGKFSKGIKKSKKGVNSLGPSLKKLAKGLNTGGWKWLAPGN